MSDREEPRLAALHEYALLDAPAGDELGAVVRVAAQVAVPARLEDPAGATVSRTLPDS